jgi:signal peptidase II
LTQKVRDYLFLGGIAGLIILFDQVSKALIRMYLPVNAVWAPWDWMLPYIRFFHTQNTGVAFGMFQGANVVLAILASLVSIAIIYYYPRIPHQDLTLRIALSLQLAGALGNLIDRILFGYVTDFVSVGNFAIFNVADSSISIGVVVLLIGVWLDEQKKSKADAAAARPAAIEQGEPGSGEVKE